MCKQELDSIVLWAVELADKYDIGIQGIIAGFISAREELKDSNKAKIFVESESKEMGRSTQ